MTRSKKKLTVSLAVMALLTAGVATASADDPPTREAYVVQAEAICQANAQANLGILRGIRKQVHKGKLKPAVSRLGRAAAALRTTVDQVKALPQPSADGPVLASWFSLLDREVSMLGQIQGLLRKHKVARAQFVAVKLNKNGRTANDTVVEFAFDWCLISSNRFV